MPSFGVIAEGPTDQVVIENILIGYFGQSPEVRYVQPPAPLGKHPAGWTRVFQCLERKDHESALQLNDYIVIHIDTDVQEEKGFDVPRRESGRELDVAERIAKVIARLQRDMRDEFLQAHGHRILFAVAVDSIECWLLPLYDERKAEKVTGCLEAANKALGKANEKGLSSGEKKSIAAYEDASAPFQKRKHLMAAHAKNPSLKRFVEVLDAALASVVAGPTAEPDAGEPGASAPSE